jgi:tRNA nucleotidyltransferase (CCA-adding enzyme)
MADPFQFFKVGGCVRDEILGIKTKDIDFSVVAEENLFPDADAAFVSLEEFLARKGFKIFEKKTEFLTIRAQIPADNPLRALAKDADFVLARKEGPYSDGRHPDWVLPGTFEDDIFRRDFTANALAIDADGNLIDIVGGKEDIENRELRFVGSAEERIKEDGLRVMRAFRFQITKGFVMAPGQSDILTTEFASEMLTKVKAERIREELIKMFQSNTLRSLQLLGKLPDHTQRAIFRDGLNLDATFKGKKGV